MTLVRLEPTAPLSGVKHSTTEPLRSLSYNDFWTELHTYDGFAKVIQLYMICPGPIRDQEIGMNINDKERSVKDQQFINIKKNKEK